MNLLSKLKPSKGFTLIELLVVISIIGLLSSVVLASLSTAREKGRIAAGQQMQSSINHGYEAVAYFDFDNGVGDSLGSGYTLAPSPNGSPCAIVNDSPDKVGKGMQCSAGSGPSFLPNSDDSDATKNGSQFSIALWFKPVGVSNSIGINGYLAGRAGAHMGPYIYKSDNSLNASIWYTPGADPGYVNLYPNPKVILQSNKWYFIVLSVDSVGRVAALYLDGKKIASTALSSSLLRDYTSPYFTNPLVFLLVLCPTVDA